MSHTEGEILHSSMSKEDNINLKKSLSYWKYSVLFKLAKVSYFTLAKFSIACKSCVTGAVIGTTSIVAVGVDVTYRRGNTAFVNV